MLVCCQAAEMMIGLLFWESLDFLSEMRLGRDCSCGVDMSFTGRPRIDSWHRIYSRDGR